MYHFYYTRSRGRVTESPLEFAKLNVACMLLGPGKLIFPATYSPRPQTDLSQTDLYIQIASMFRESWMISNSSPRNSSTTSRFTNGSANKLVNEELIRFFFFVFCAFSYKFFINEFIKQNNMNIKLILRKKKCNVLCLCVFVFFWRRNKETQNRKERMKLFS